MALLPRLDAISQRSERSKASGYQAAYRRGRGFAAGDGVAHEVYRGAAGGLSRGADDPEVGPIAQSFAASDHLAGTDNGADWGRLFRCLEGENRMATRGRD